MLFCKVPKSLSTINLKAHGLEKTRMQGKVAPKRSLQRETKQRSEMDVIDIFGLTTSAVRIAEDRQ